VNVVRLLAVVPVVILGVEALAWIVGIRRPR
jgi:hypothetical protein